VEGLKQAVATGYDVDPAKGATTGFDATRPKEPNDTAEGRARGRRAELVR
jgi:flagellar motor protein MotB